jgi:hypothetical protein
MNILENYDIEKLKISEPYNIDDDNYFCKFSYNNMPFVIKTNKICYLKPRQKNSNNYINISLTSPDYLLWFENFYKDCIQLVFKKSDDWFEEKLSFSDIEFSFINPLKSNIKDACFDIQCITDENRLHIVDSNNNVLNLDNIKESKVIPTFHIKGVKFNSKHFLFEIELNNLYIILEDNLEEPLIEQNEDTPVETNTPIITNTPVETNTPIVTNMPVETNAPVETNTIINTPIKCDTDDLALNEYTMPTDNLENTNINIDNNEFFKVYNIINTRIKDDIIKHLRDIFIQKKIRNDIDLNELIDDEDEN